MGYQAHAFWVAKHLQRTTPVSCQVNTSSRKDGQMWQPALSLSMHWVNRWRAYRATQPPPLLPHERRTKNYLCLRLRLLRRALSRALRLAGSLLSIAASGNCVTPRANTTPLPMREGLRRSAEITTSFSLGPKFMYLLPWAMPPGATQMAAYGE